jgi:hypothetical protein
MNDPAILLEARRRVFARQQIAKGALSELFE